MSKNKWSSRMAFIITSSAFAVGLGNIWRFPYIAGEGGGGAFLLVYIFLVFLLGIPVMLTEITLGRMSKTTPLLGFAKLTNNKASNLIGGLGVTACLLIMGFYVMILAWIVVYIWEFISGNISLIADASISTHFDSVASNIPVILLVVLGIMVVATLIVRQGLQSGLERYSKFMMIALIILLIALTIWSATLDNAIEGYRWFLYPDFSKITLEVMISALGQLFFSIGVGMAVAFAFGSYTSNKENLVTSTAWIVFADTFFAIVAGLLIFPAIFSFGLAPDSGPNLVFVTMTTIFNSIGHGAWLGALFFALLFLAGFTSLITSIQGIQDSLADGFQISENMALLSTVFIISLISVPSVFSYVDEPFMLFGKNMFGLLDYITNTIMLPLGGLLIMLIAGHVVGFDKLKAHLDQSSPNAINGNVWKPLVKYIIPLAILIILLNGIF